MTEPVEDANPARNASPGAQRWHESESLTLLREVMGVAREMTHALAARVNVSELEFQALEHLQRSPIGPAEIARLLDVSTAASTGIVDRLVAKGHAERQPHPQDRRRTRVVVTPSAQAEVRAHMGPMFQRLAAMDAALSQEDRAVVVRYLRGALDAVAAVMEAEPDSEEETG
ncbi:MarR family winged helix-turn-helix transcriptional regulator [Serinibacter salmoneus]|uniref:DNA-binding MarR family transcriptional regulator n=1 Tax=Serinibacter salmoneus TaxID=556530 RepID=A0A2A9D1D2_9MICO|nr:MarR family winged helix-turn-helix transcriptional regulator [Serinibacter salmoneus]PFG20166.1 DNA-binding MarR family transcriptional regulator [Serinibacter salmoneus]